VGGTFLRGLVISSLVIWFGPLNPSPSHLSVASAACGTGGSINGKDGGRMGQVIGNAGTVFVNNITTTEHGVVRSMMASNNLFYNQVEFGWSFVPDPPYYETGPLWFVAWKINGNYDDYSGVPLTAGNKYRFRLQDDNANTYWGFFLDGTRQSFRLDHNFSYGSAFTNSEIDSTCDTGYSHFENLNDCISQGCATYYTYGNLQCRNDAMSGYKFNKVSDGEHYTEAGDAAC
jgi:hypothetical protein